MRDDDVMSLIEKRLTVIFVSVDHGDRTEDDQTF